MPVGIAAAVVIGAVLGVLIVVGVINPIWRLEKRVEEIAAEVVHTIGSAVRSVGDAIGTAVRSGNPLPLVLGGGVIVLFIALRR